MKLPLKLGASRKDAKNGGEFYVVKDADGAWIGDIRAEHAPEMVAALNAQRAEEKPTLDAIAAKLNGIANAMASCVVPDFEQFNYWRKSVEEAYDLARGEKRVSGPESR